jgi:hypothetical protein
MRMRWFISHDGDVKGPFSPAEVRREIEAGRLRAGTHVRDEGGKWAPVEESPFGGFITSKRQSNLPNSVILGAVGLAVILGLTDGWKSHLPWSLAKSQFTPDDIERIEEQVRADFAKRDGIRVIEVSLIKESKTKLTGFAKLKVGELEVTRNCEAFLGEDGAEVHKCQ